MNTYKEKTNYFTDFFKAWIYLFLYALKGIKFICFDMWKLIIKKPTTKQEREIKKIKEKIDDKDEQEKIYERTKNRVKAQKYYKYTPRQLAKYEKMKKNLLLDLQSSGATRSKTANIYQYTVRDLKGNGKIITDTMTGFSKLDVNTYLLNEGYEVYSIKSSKLINLMYKDSSLLSSTISTNDLVFWLTQLSTYLKAGITLSEAIKILSMQMKKKKRLSKVLKSISYELLLGQSFSDALTKQGNFFPALLINMVKAAEATGTIQETLEDMANYYDDINKTKKEMRSAMTYPAIITIFALAVCTFIMVYVVPSFSNIYKSFGSDIPQITKIVINISNFLQHNLLYVILGILLVCLSIALLYRYSRGFKTTMQILLMKLPVVKSVIIYKELTIFSKTFSSLLKNNVFITDSMDILSKITSNEIYKSIMYKTISNIVKGDKISEAFKNHWAVPDVAYYMIVTGESTGQLAEMMQKVSDYYQVMHKNIVGSLKSLIEPIMIVFLAVIVGVIMISVIVPIFSLYNSIL